MYVEDLIGPQTVNTMPEETITAFQDHGNVEDTLERDIDKAERVLDDTRQAGIDYDDVTDTLEREGVQKFIDSFVDLKQGIAEKRDALAVA
jgi:transaldolase